MWKYNRKYFLYVILGALFISAEVLTDLLQPGLMSRIVDEGVLGLGKGDGESLRIVLRCGIQMISIAVLGGLFGSLSNLFINLESQNTVNDIRKDVFHRMLLLSAQQTDDFTAGSLITRVTNDITQIEDLLAQYVRGFVRTFFCIFGSLFFIYRENVRFGLVISCVLPFLLGCMAICLYSGQPIFERLQTELDRINCILREDISGIRIIKACVRETAEKIKFGQANRHYMRTQLRVLVLFAVMNPFITTLMNLAVVMILYFASGQIRAGMTSPGGVIAVVTYTSTMLGGVLSLVLLFQSVTRGMASWKRVKEVLRCEPDILDGGEEEIPAGSGELEFREVYFRYPQGRQDVLKGISFHVRPGETLAVLGATGSGKSSLVRLIPRLHDVTAGQILLDGVDIRDYSLKALRGRVSIALQKSELFSRSIRENISWGDPAAEEEEITAAVRTAQAETFVWGQKNGLDSLVAERGMSLSGGQKQRLSLARTILKKAEIYIFDDATSALDFCTEADFYEALRRFRPGTTKIIVAQRLVSVRSADRILVLDNGTVAGCGSHETLMESCSLYRDIYRSQMEEDRDAG